MYCKLDLLHLYSTSNAFAGNMAVATRSKGEKGEGCYFFQPVFALSSAVSNGSLT